LAGIDINELYHIMYCILGLTKYKCSASDKDLKPMSDITKLKLITYFLGIALVVFSTLLSGLVISLMLWALRTLGFSPEEQLPWLQLTLIWMSIIVIVTGSTAFVHDMTSDLEKSSPGFLLLWTVTIGFIWSALNAAVGEPFFSMDALYGVAISLVTVIVLKRDVIQPCVTGHLHK